MSSNYSPYERDKHDHKQFDHKSFWRWFIVWFILIILLA